MKRRLRCWGLLAKSGTPFLRAPEYPLAICGRQPSNRALHSISQFVGIELRRSVSSDISAGLIGEPAQGILGT